MKELTIQDIETILHRDENRVMEAWGRGIPDIFNECKAAGLPKPEFESIPNFVCLTIRFKEPLTPHLSGDRINEPLNGPVNEPLNATLKLLSVDNRSVYDAIKANPGIRRTGIVAQTGLNLAKVKRAIATLVSKGLIEHRDSDKTGGYHIK